MAIKNRTFLYKTQSFQLKHFLYVAVSFGIFGGFQFELLTFAETLTFKINGNHVGSNGFSVAGIVFEEAGNTLQLDVNDRKDIIVCLAELHATHNQVFFVCLISSNQVPFDFQKIDPSSS